ncbi:ABC transporter permease [Anaerolineales bacterium HSG25]|nr:ABC transporter permease [Anaerolineales bacterium HSG25]
MAVAQQPVSLGDDEYEEQGAWQRLAYIGRLLRRDRGGMIGSVLFVLIVLTAMFAPVIAPHDPLKQNLRAAKQPPAWTEEGTWEYPLGTDNLGRDMFSRIIYGTRVSLTVGFFGVLIACMLGLISGLVAGYRGGTIDNVLMSIINLFLAIPYLVIVVVIASILGRSLFIVILIFGITDSPLFARVTRGEVLRIRQSGYVESARSAGASNFRIQFDHILPNLIGPLITLATFEMSAMIFYEAGLGFLGLSVPPSVPSWGNMLAQGRKYLDIYPWIAIYPGIAIAITALSFNLLGDWLRDVLDPRLRRSR